MNHAIIIALAALTLAGCRTTHWDVEPDAQAIVYHVERVELPGE